MHLPLNQPNQMRDIEATTTGMVVAMDMEEYPST
jgi:hypothetical protein